MRKTTIRNLIHFILILIPIFMLFICVLQPLKNAEGGDITTDTHTETTINYGQTNTPTSNNDLVVGNYYKINTKNLEYNYGNSLLGLLVDNKINAISFDIIGFENFGFENILEIDENLYSTNYTKTNINCIIDTSEFYYLQIGNEDTYIGYLMSTPQFSLNTQNDSYIIIKLTSIEIQEIFNIHYIEECPQEYLPIQSVTQQTIEGTRYNYDLIRPFETFYNLNINSWYNNVLNIIGLENNSRISNYIFHYPLYLMWFFLFEIIEIVLTAVPKLIIHICKKIGGEEV